MKEEDKEKTAFITPWGTFHYKVMPFGLKNAGATYQRAMIALFHDMMHQEIEVYVDDMIAKTRPGESHVKTLKKLFDRLREFKLRLNPAKCVFGATSGAMLAQESPVDVKERAIYYLSKKFTESELKYPDVEKTCAALVWVLHRLRQYTLHYQTFLVTENDPIKYLLDRPALVGIPNDDDSFLDDRVLNVNEDLWKMFFDGAVNLSGSGCNWDRCGQVKSVRRLHTNHNADVGEWKTKEAKLLPYHKYLEDLVEKFEEVSFEYLPRSHNQFADALATLSSMLQVTDGLEVEPLKIEVLSKPAYCMVVIEEPDGKPWYHDIMTYIQKREFPEGSNPADRKHLMKLASKFFISGDTLYKRSFDSVLLRCVNAKEATQLMEEIHEGVCGPHMSGHMLAKKIMRLGYFWLTLETDCIQHVRSCHRCRFMETR
ncbi:uncharacterized protein LOC120292911 [Eucalyptus grandis]|uniref:uncharacterized protein LOC120292911 n=1 Tax=Eucalyptus grandis TaxID=71139 RepID=UPI00192EE81D|nr:uncharacterized protein LOC120292911 [Eucalyptus grandis]